MSRRALEQQHKQANDQRLKRLARGGLLVTALLLSFSALTLFVVDQVLRPDLFVIDQLKIKGRFAHLKPQQIERVVLQHQTGNFFSLNLSEIKRRVEAMRWVDKADVRREWPDTLTVRVVEHRPVMQLNDNAWVNIRGQVVDLPEYQTQKPVIKLNGQSENAKSMMVNALEWAKRLESHNLLLREVTLSRTGAWNLRLRYHDDTDSTPDEFELLLGSTDVEQRLSRFEQLFDRRFRFSKERLIRADARYPDGIAVKTKPVALQQDTRSRLGQARQQVGEPTAKLVWHLTDDSMTLRRTTS